MERILRVARLAVAVLIVVALAWQFRWSTDNSPTFTAGNFFSYFTVLSNVLLTVTFVALVVRPTLADDVGFLTLRGTATLGIIVTGLVDAVLLAPTSADVDVTLRWVNFVLHILAPIAGLADRSISVRSTSRIPGRIANRSYEGRLALP